MNRYIGGNLVFNFDGRGNGEPVLLFETSVPDDTDFTIFRRQSIQSLSLPDLEVRGLSHHIDTVG